MGTKIANGMATIQCSHGGTGTVTVNANTKVKAVGSLVLVNISGTIVGCPFTIPGTPPVPSPCVTFSITGTATKVKVNGSPVILEGDQGPAVNPGDPTATVQIITAGQSAVKGI